MIDGKNNDHLNISILDHIGYDIKLEHNLDNLGYV